ncbi:MAG: DUF362 domain-containing protein [Opitutales bacterium]
MERRTFIKTAGAISAAIPAFNSGVFADTKEADSSKPVDLVALHGGEAADMFEKGIAEMGGMSRFVKEGQKVVIKMNASFNRTPEFGATTNPQLVGAVVKHCKQAGASEILCLDYTCGSKDWNGCYTISGIKAEVEANGGKMIAANSQNLFKEQEIPNGVAIKKAMVHEMAINPDVLINIPVLKQHSGTKITGAMKNFMGLVWNRRDWHNSDLPQCIADYCTFQKPALNILDAYRVMLEFGPRGRSAESAPVVKYQVISTDIVATDTAAVGIFASVVNQHKIGIPYGLGEIGYIKKGEDLGIGTTDLSKLNVKKISLA